ncbi:PriCT-2 domain-containing protein [Bradyrhizobium diazoefficiens]|nr:PriCT-2 domain-containing protein [Bradyrhizobium diazoefficiens]MBR0847113.1 PriCT-2 domain-containing protein [Bradyrhizobium diazoefficiens]
MIKLEPAQQLTLFDEDKPLGVRGDGPLWNIPDAHRRVHVFPVTFFNDVAAKVAHFKMLSLEELQQIILDARAPTKVQLRLLKLARFGDRRTLNGSLRHNENTEAISGIELDYDKEQVSFEMALQHLQRLNCHALIYTSPSHTDAKPRWRILMPLSREYHPDFRQIMVRRMDFWFGGNGFFDASSKTLSQAFYFGNCDQCVVVRGQYFVDLREELRCYDKRKSVPTAEFLEMLVMDSGKGVSLAPEDNPRQESPEETELKITCALAVIPSDEYWTWLRIGAAIFDGMGDAGLGLFDEWSRESSKYNARECQRKWRECAKMRNISVRTIFWEADQQDSRWRDTYKKLATEGV